MSAIRNRRRRSTLFAFVAAVLVIAAAAGLGVVGVQTLADSTAGHRAEGSGVRLPTQRLPYTPTALVGTLDDTGRLTTVLVLAIEPDGTGGSIVELAASADANSGTAETLNPLNALLATQDPEAFALAVEALTGVSFDVVELVDQRRLAQLIAPLGDLAVQMPIALYDASSGEQWPKGEIVMGGPVAARAVTAVDPEIEDWLFEPGRAAVWRAVADRVGAGIGSAVPVASDADLPRPADLDSFLDRLFAASVRFRELSILPIDAERVEEQLPMELGVAFGVAAKDAVAVHDLTEVLMVMGAVAPGRVGAPLAAPSFRVVMGFPRSELEPLGLRGSDLLKEAIVRLLFMKVNVVSVAELPGSTVPEHSTFVVADPSTIDGVSEEYAAAFGDEIEVRAAESLIEGIDIELVLGRDFLEMVRANEQSAVAGLGDDDSADSSSGTDVDS